MSKNIKIRNAKLWVVFPYTDENDRELRKRQKVLPEIADDAMDEWFYEEIEDEEYVID